ncbi:MAG: purine-nucleoside phosphorylase [Actinomycetes bacterium]
MTDARARAAEAAAAIAERTGVPRHDAIVVLGSGWDTAADSLGRVVAQLRTADLPGFLPPAAPGHRGLLRSCDLDGLTVLVFLGRTHLFEGHGAAAVAHAVRSGAASGAEVAVLTNASGGLRADWAPGTAALIADHINWTYASPLSGATFVDLTDAWSPRLRAAARRLDPSLVEGVYAQLTGPSIQTVAETGMLRTIGADLVGMSTVIEAIAARAAGLELFGLSAVTTREGTGEQLDPNDVVRIAQDTAARAAPLLGDVLRGWRDSRTSSTRTSSTVGSPPEELT